jgi:sugar phosphate permease
VENQALAENASVAGDQSVGIFYGWWVVFAAAVGTALHIGPIVVGTFGVFLKPLSHEFGWSRSQISFAFSLFAIAGAISAPVVGRLVDYVGARRVILAATSLYGLGVLALALLSGHVWLLYGIYFFIGVVGTGTTPVPYAKVITRWFDRSRGLALGLTVAASSLGLVAMPYLAQALIAAVGWRRAYLIIALMVLGIAIPVVALLLKESPQTIGLEPDGGTVGRTSEPPPGDEDKILAFSQAWRSTTFWLIAVPFFLMSLSFHGCILHLVALLTDRGISPHDAAIAASLVGAGGLVARLGGGYLLDRFFAPAVAVWLFLSSTLGLVLLWSGAPGFVPFLAGFLIGIGQGAELDIIPYMVSRYFGLAAFAHIYGYLFAAFLLGGVLGPPLMGWGFDTIGSYRPIIAIFTFSTLLAIGLVSRLGPYSELKLAPTGSSLITLPP